MVDSLFLGFFPFLLVFDYFYCFFDKIYDINIYGALFVFAVSYYIFISSKVSAIIPFSIKEIGDKY
jgi:hypothetical protein